MKVYVSMHYESLLTWETDDVLMESSPSEPLLHFWYRMLKEVEAKGYQLMPSNTIPDALPRLYRGWKRMDTHHVAQHDLPDSNVVGECVYLHTHSTEIAYNVQLSTRDVWVIGLNGGSKRFTGTAEAVLYVKQMLTEMSIRGFL